MRTAGAIAGLMVLGSFVIPGTYTAKTDLIGGVWAPDGTRIASSMEGDLGFATLSGRVVDTGGACIKLTVWGCPHRRIRDTLPGCRT